MKKLILILFVALMGSFTVVFGQAPNLTDPPVCPTPTSIVCLTSDALHPVPGTEYTYEVNVPSPPGLKYYTWLVTQDQTFIDPTGLVATPETNDGSGPHIEATGTGYNDPLNGTDTIDITWKSWTHDPDLPVFLVIYVEDDACGNDNIQLYIIEPMHAFTLDLANIASDGSAQADAYATCVSAVASAIYNAGTLEMDFGINYMFFAVTAANFTDSWMPSFEIDGAGLTDSRVVTAIDWAYPAEAVTGTWHTTAGGGGAGSIWIGSDPVVASGGSGSAVGAAGECIIVRMTIANNQVETLADDVIQLAVDGIMLDPAIGGYVTVAYGDIHYDVGPSGCGWVDGYDNDHITQVLSPRPDIQAVDPTPFVPTNAE